VKHGPAELDPLAEWVRGIGTAEKLGLLVQQSIGRLFVETFTATEESLAAARCRQDRYCSCSLLDGKIAPNRGRSSAISQSQHLGDSPDVGFSERS
jgi:hypothetical protein